MCTAPSFLYTELPGEVRAETTIIKHRLAARYMDPLIVSNLFPSLRKPPPSKGPSGIDRRVHLLLKHCGEPPTRNREN